MHCDCDVEEGEYVEQSVPCDMWVCEKNERHTQWTDPNQRWFDWNLEKVVQKGAKWEAE